jgi:hypothetical protein
MCGLLTRKILQVLKRIVERSFVPHGLTAVTKVPL